MEGIASIDLFVVPTIAFQQLFALLVLGHERRRLLWFAVTCNPTAEWLARQITEAFPWDTAPKYLIRDNDRAFGSRSRLGCEQWGSGTDQRRSARPGRTDTLNARSARSGASARIICSCSTPSTFAELFRNTSAIIMRDALTFRLGRTRRADVQSSDSETLSRIRFLAGYIIVTPESDFSEATSHCYHSNSVRIASSLRAEMIFGKDRSGCRVGRAPTGKRRLVTSATFRGKAMTDDQLKEWASKLSSEIVKREGAALALSACDHDKPAIEADSNLLGIAIAQAIMDAYRAGLASTAAGWEAQTRT
jgi:hypothetical protein